MHRSGEREGCCNRGFIMAEKLKKTTKKEKNIKKLVDTEEKRLTSFLRAKRMDEDKLNIALDIIKDVAYMTVKTVQLKQEIEEQGMVETYQNGANQFGRKKSAAFDAYIQLTKQKSALIKQLTDLLPEQEFLTVAEVKDEFDDFVNARSKK